MKQLYKMRGGVLVTALLIAMAVLFAGCGSDDDDDEPTKYSVTIASTIEHGKVTADKKSSVKGETVTLTATPDEGYTFSAFSVKDAKNNDITVSDRKFTMPESNVTVTATFTENSSGGEASAATVTTAPTATTGDITAGSNTALVTAGVANGGTMMYAVTTENTKPTSTEGFTATVPTAESRAAGTFYVWYYVKADSTHTDSAIADTAIAVTVNAAATAVPPATVTTAPTATTGDITAGSTTALVTAGVANGGTMMYVVTTENTKPTTTAGFTATVPTAESITAAGTVYVWYYVKADSTHTDSEIAGSVTVTVNAAPAAGTTVTWDNTNVFVEANQGDVDNWDKGPVTFEGVSISFTGSGANSSFTPYGGMGESELKVFESTGGQFTFTAPSGKQFTKIEITDNSFANFTAYGDWTKNGNKQAVWSGTPSNTVTLGRGSGYSNSYLFNELQSIVFTLVDAN